MAVACRAVTGLHIHDELGRLRHYDCTIRIVVDTTWLSLRNPGRTEITVSLGRTDVEHRMMFLNNHNFS